jgi:hypothetical protein
MDAPANHGTNFIYLEATATKWRNDSVNNAMQFFKMQLFRAAIPGNISKVVTAHHSKPKQISKPQCCIVASGDKMSSCGVFEVDLWIKGRKSTHPANVIQELNKNIIGVYFIHAHRLTYDVIAHQVKFSGAGTNSIAALKKVVLPAMTSMIVKAKFEGLRDAQANYVANICAPRMPMSMWMTTFAALFRKTALSMMSR